MYLTGLNSSSSSSSILTEFLNYFFPLFSGLKVMVLSLKLTSSRNVFYSVKLLDSCMSCTIDLSS